MSDAAFMPVACASYDWIPFLSPPTSSEAPSTSSRLPMIEPVIEAWTISILLSSDQEAGNDDLADVADGGVHDAADARAGRHAELLRGVSEGIGQAQDGERG